MLDMLEAMHQQTLFQEEVMGLMPGLNVLRETMGNWRPQAEQEPLEGNASSEEEGHREEESEREDENSQSQEEQPPEEEEDRNDGLLDLFRMFERDGIVLPTFDLTSIKGEPESVLLCHIQNVNRSDPMVEEQPFQIGDPRLPFSSLYCEEEHRTTCCFETKEGEILYGGYFQESYKILSESSSLPQMNPTPFAYGLTSSSFPVTLGILNMAKFSDILILFMENGPILFLRQSLLLYAAVTQQFRKHVFTMDVPRVRFFNTSRSVAQQDSIVYFINADWEVIKWDLDKFSTDRTQGFETVLFKHLHLVDISASQAGRVYYLLETGVVGVVGGERAFVLATNELGGQQRFSCIEAFDDSLVVCGSNLNDKNTFVLLDSNLNANQFIDIGTEGEHQFIMHLKAVKKQSRVLIVAASHRCFIDLLVVSGRQMTLWLPRLHVSNRCRLC